MPYPVVSLPILGTGIEETIEVTYFARFLRGPDGRCAYCQGYLTDHPDPESRIRRYLARNRTWATTCPVCEGQAT